MDSRVASQAHGDLSEAGVDARHMACSVLQQTVGEPAGRGADVEAGAVFHINRPMIQRSLKLHTAAADIALIFSKDAYCSFV